MANRKANALSTDYLDYLLLVISAPQGVTQKTLDSLQFGKIY